MGREDPIDLYCSKTLLSQRRSFSVCGSLFSKASMRHHTMDFFQLNLNQRQRDLGTLYCGQFNWGGFLLKSNAGVQRQADSGGCLGQNVWVCACLTDCG